MSRADRVPVFLASVPADSQLPQRAHFLCQALLASGRDCVHIDIPRRGAPLAWLRRPRGPAHVLRPSLASIRSWWSLPESEQFERGLRQGRRLRRRLQAHYDPERLVAVVETPQWLPWLEGLGIEHVVYDRIDEVAAHAPRPEAQQRLASWEGELIERCSAAVVSSRGLSGPIRARRPELPLCRIPNGVDLEAFERLAKTETAPPELARFPGPRVGFVGALYHWLDVELIDAVTAALPNVGFVFIGPADARHTPHPRANVLQLGPVPHERVPACIDAFDVGWLPFRNEAVGRSANPIKLYEYLALGKPVVTTPLADLDEFSGLVSVGESAQEVVRLLEERLADGSTGEKRVALARNCSWRHRADALVAFIDELDAAAPSARRPSRAGPPARSEQAPTRQAQQGGQPGPARKPS